MATSIFTLISGFHQLTSEERTSLRTFFINNPDRKNDTIEALMKSCENDEERVTCLQGLLTSGKSLTMYRYYTLNTTKWILA